MAALLAIAAGSPCCGEAAAHALVSCLDVYASGEDCVAGGALDHFLQRGCKRFTHTPREHAGYHAPCTAQCSVVPHCGMHPVAHRPPPPGLSHGHISANDAQAAMNGWALLLVYARSLQLRTCARPPGAPARLSMAWCGCCAAGGSWCGVQERTSVAGQVHTSQQDAGQPPSTRWLAGHGHQALQPPAALWASVIGLEPFRGESAVSRYVMPTVMVLPATVCGSTVLV